MRNIEMQQHAESSLSGLISLPGVWLWFLCQRSAQRQGDLIPSDRTRVHQTSSSIFQYGRMCVCATTTTEHGPYYGAVSHSEGERGVTHTHTHRLHGELAAYLHYQDAHANGSHEMLVVIEPLLHLLIAALGDRRTTIEE